MPVLFFDPGQLSVRLELEEVQTTADGQGGAVESWVSRGGLWARIEPVRARPNEDAGQDHAVVTHRIWVRYRGDIEAGMRLTKNGRVFDIRALRDPDESGRYLVCLCEEGRL